MCWSCIPMWDSRTGHTFFLSKPCEAHHLNNRIALLRLSLNCIEFAALHIGCLLFAAIFIFYFWTLKNTLDAMNNYSTTAIAIKTDQQEQRFSWTLHGQLQTARFCKEDILSQLLVTDLDATSSTIAMFRLALAGCPRGANLCRRIELWGQRKWT